MAEITNPQLHVGRVISDDPANGIAAVKNSDGSVSNIVSRSLATGDVTHSAPANSSGTNTRRHLYDRPIVSTSTIEGTTITGTSLALSGAITGATAITTTGLMRASDVTVDGSGAVNWFGRSEFQSPSDGVIVAYNAARTAFTRFNLGGTTSSFPSIKRSSAALNFRLADDSADCAITAAAITASGAVTGHGFTTATFAVNLTGAGISSPLNTIHTFPALTSGLFHLDSSAGDGGLFFIDGGVVRVIYADTTNVYSITPSAASKISVYISAGVLKVENKYGAVTLHGWLIKTR